MNKQEVIECKCGCKGLVLLYDKKGRKRVGYLLGHYGNWNNGLTRSVETREKIRKAREKQIITTDHKKKISLALKGKKLNSENPQWKGDQAGYTAFHNWVKRRLPKPSKCSFCKQAKRLDLSNKTGNYSRDIVDWIWLCHSCHLSYDFKNKVWNRFRLEGRM